jgi:hypothetical protein
MLNHFRYLPKNAAGQCEGAEYSGAPHMGCVAGASAISD